MNHIFFDTNTIEHSQNIIFQTIELHKKNASFYKNAKCYILPQVYRELTDYKTDINKGLGEIIKIIILDDQLEYHENLILNLKDYVLKNEDIKTSISIDGDTIGDIIENTDFGQDYLYYGFNYRDLNRSIGNFIYDDKNYNGKKPKQQSKIWKDALVFSELIFRIERIGVAFESDKLYFICSDKYFCKEINKFLSEFETRRDSEYYKDFSLKWQDTIKNIITIINVLYLSPKECHFIDANKHSFDILE